MVGPTDGPTAERAERAERVETVEAETVRTAEIWRCPGQLHEWHEWLAAGLHGRCRWRLGVVLFGMLFAAGRRTVTSWLRAAGVSDDYRDYYYFLGSLGRNGATLAERLLRLVLRLIDSGVLTPADPEGRRLVAAIDDSPTKRFGRHVQGAGRHRNPTPGPAGAKFLYGHVWVTLALLVRHPLWGTIALPLWAKLYVRQKDTAGIPPDARGEPWPFQTKLALAAAMVRLLAKWARIAERPLWVVTDGGYASRPFLKPALAAGAVVVSRLRCDAALCDLPPKVKKRGPGQPRKYGPNRIRLARRATHRQGWQSLSCRLYGRQQTVQFKTFLATWRPAGGAIRVVLVRWGKTWAAFFCTDPTARAEQILEAVADRAAIEQVFHDVKEIGGAGQQQVRRAWASIGCWLLGLWMHTLVELWAWNEPAEKLVDRSASPWDEAERRPSHADRRKALKRQVLREEFSALAATEALLAKTQQLIQRLAQVAV